MHYLYGGESVNKFTLCIKLQATCILPMLTVVVSCIPHVLFQKERKLMHLCPQRLQLYNCLHLHIVLYCVNFCLEV